MKDELQLIQLEKMWEQFVRNFYMVNAPKRAPLNLVKGDLIRVTAFGQTCDAVVSLASANGVSLMIQFDAMLGGYVGMMPVVWNDESAQYEELFRGAAIQIEHTSGD